jgi:hypothetical protein
VHGALAATQSTGHSACAAFGTIAFGTVVGCEENGCVIGQLSVVQSAHQRAEGVVELGDVAVVLAEIFK